jgi:hypothetical protein
MALWKVLSFNPEKTPCGRLLAKKELYRTGQNQYNSGSHVSQFLAPASTGCAASPRIRICWLSRPTFMKIFLFNLKEAAKKQEAYEDKISGTVSGAARHFDEKRG